MRLSHPLRWPLRVANRWSARSTLLGLEITSTGSTGPRGRSAVPARMPRTSFRRRTLGCSRGPRLLRNEDDLGYLLRALRNTFLNQKRTESRRLRTGPLPDQLDLVADPTGARAGGRARGRRALRGDRRAPGRLPRRARRRRHRGPVVQGGGACAADPRRHGDEPPLPRAAGGRAPARRRPPAVSRSAACRPFRRAPSRRTRL